MSDFDPTNSGVAFLNDRKTANNHPDYKGSINIEGVEYWQSIWIKTAGPNAKNAGQKFLSFAFQPKEEVPAQELDSVPLASGGKKSPNEKDPFANTPDFGDVPVDDDIPF